MTREEQYILDKTAEIFQEDGDVANTLENYARGFISKGELADRLEYLLQSAETLANNPEPDEGDYDGDLECKREMEDRDEHESLEVGA